MSTSRSSTKVEALSGIDLVPDLVPDDTDLGKILGDGAHNLATGTLLQVDVDLGMERQEPTQRRREELCRCRRIGEEAHSAPQAFRVFRQLRTHPLQLLMTS